MPFKYQSPEERIIANSFLSEDSFYNGTRCWIWMGRYRPNGYPTINLRWKGGSRKGKVRSEGAHRYSYCVFKGVRFHHRYVAKHLCNNPACVNPEHLSSGSQKSNVRQCVKQGRHGNMHRKPVNGHKRRIELPTEEVSLQLLAHFERDIHAVL